MLERIAVSGFRNIESAELGIGERLSLVVGDNGAGKTSLLEAVHCLARARSFLPGSLDGLTRHGAAGWWVRGHIATDQERHLLGIGREGRRTRVRLDGEAVRRLSDVAWLVPVQVLNTRSQRLLSDGPGERRAFLNWGVFHVEHGFAAAWRRYERALLQRNAALRARDGRVAAAWEPEMAAAAAQVDEQRARFLEALWPHWEGYVAAWLGDGSVRWSYQRGWPQDVGLEEQLGAKRERELALGYSLSGPQRADLRFLAGGRDAGAELSRGQQKLLVASLRFALIGLLREQSARVAPLLLIDDLPSELDGRNQRRVVEAAAWSGAQIIVTAIERQGIELGNVTPDAVFHVEQGQVHDLL